MPLPVCFQRVSGDVTRLDNDEVMSNTSKQKKHSHRSARHVPAYRCGSGLRPHAVPASQVPPLIPPLIRVLLPSAMRPRSQVKAQTLQIKGFDQRPQSESKVRTVFGTEGCRFESCRAY